MNNVTLQFYQENCILKIFTGNHFLLNVYLLRIIYYYKINFTIKMS